MVSAVSSCCCAGAADAARAAAEVLHGMAMGVSNFLSGSSVVDGESTRSATMCSLETSTPNEASAKPRGAGPIFPRRTCPQRLACNFACGSGRKQDMIGHMEKPCQDGRDGSEFDCSWGVLCIICPCDLCWVPSRLCFVFLKISTTLWAKRT